jgi:peptidoglycan/LPS O-acetylase OafA/YrhL
VKRLDSIDVARGLAALSVAGYHYSTGRTLAALTGCSMLTFLDWPGANVAVPVFFVVSGFCIHLAGLRRDRSEPYLLPFLTQRFFRIYPAWFLAVILSAYIGWLYGTPPSSREIVTHLTLTNGFFNSYSLNPVLWSVSVEFFIYLLYPAWLMVRERFGLGVSLACGLLVSAGSIFCTTMLFEEARGAQLWFFLNVWIGWLAGAALAEVQVKFMTRRVPLKLWMAALVALLTHAILIASGTYSTVLRFAQLPITICLSTIPVAALIHFGDSPSAPQSYWRRRCWQWLATIGVFSYSLYLLHEPLINLRFLIAGPELWHLSFRIVLSVVWIGVILAISWLSYLYLEVPTSRLGQRLASKVRMYLQSRRTLLPGASRVHSPTTP